MPEERLRSIIAESVARRAGRPPIDVFTDGDSLDRLEAVLAIEAELQISLDETELSNLQTFQDLDQMVERALAAPPPKPTPVPESSPPPVSPADVPSARWGTTPARLLAAFARWWLRVEISGADHLPNSGGALLCTNHTSHLDSLVLLVAAGNRRDQLVFAAAKDYFFQRSGLIRWATRLLPLIPWEREGDLAAMSQNLRHLAACRNADRIVVFFPEGNRSASGTLQPFREGLTFFAQRSQLPVIPGWIEGAYQALPKGRRWPRRTRVKVHFGPMLAPPAEGEAFVPAVRDAVLRLQPQ